MTIELKPCPFCGSDARMTEIGNAHTKSRTVEIKCSNAMCRATMVNKAMMHTMRWLAAKSAESWNQRK